MTHTLVLYCKSFIDDIHRAKCLAESIDQFNTEKIPFYMSVPQKDFKKFEMTLQNNHVHLLSDEEIISKNPSLKLDSLLTSSGRISQQVVKSEFWRMSFCDNYVCLDSDSTFIRPFKLSDFMYDHTTPYTVFHSGTDLLQWAARAKKQKHIDNFNADRTEIRNLFSRSSRLFDFGPTPCIWSAKVWKSLDTNYLQTNNIDFHQLIVSHPHEMLIYGETLLAYDAIKLIPTDPLFKVFHYKAQYDESIKLGETHSSLSVSYLGVIKQSNWDESKDFYARKKRTWRSLWLKR